MTGTDTAVQNRLVALGFVVTVVDDNVVDVFMAEASNVVFISNTCNPASGIANLATSRATIVLSHAGLYDEFGLTQVGDNGMVPGQTTIDIIDPSHPLAAGLSGTVTVLTNPNAIGWGVPENAALVGTLMGVPSNYTLFGYEAGAIVPGGFQVMRRRVGFFLSSATGATLTSEGWTLFDASILWAFNSP
jgi:hypothetical protein